LCEIFDFDRFCSQNPHTHCLQKLVRPWSQLGEFRALDPLGL